MCLWVPRLDPDFPGDTPPLILILYLLQLNLFLHTDLQYLLLPVPKCASRAFNIGYFEARMMMRMPRIILIMFK